MTTQTVGNVPKETLQKVIGFLQEEPKSSSCAKV